MKRAPCYHVLRYSDPEKDGGFFHGAVYWVCDIKKKLGRLRLRWCRVSLEEYLLHRSAGHYVRAGGRETTIRRRNRKGR
jgi:hypothetical protein